MSFTHLDEQANPTMVDVGDKAVTRRTATARSVVRLPEAVLAALQDGDIRTKKGPVFHTAIIAGTMGAKKTSELIPFCHPLGLDSCKFQIEVIEDRVQIDCTCALEAKTGVEMEALTGATIAALTVYDMCKALSHEIVIEETRLLKKTGGKSDFQGK
ncbi:MULTISPECIES: cyclic pyranopterin monophosphate synthase MoaC [Siphonobacter]|uniref:cyclic pyranopterin monophosphate synthase n=1 Tax=Siphonobacter curvatus TaxID=2094562 RepID=A0A2S7IPB6_9BACT|nr:MULTISPECIES: cyclic pyranopterin monophosphate synthase MoaC [Siphonobacter]PMD97327.1 cyclic pyranopterin monophosphate synthase MoaC [Siphonobacter sp. BAB-5405]PQA59478.1 cyclic pyranopterin monophosphate synthase MoaC [Siphonobacter curvatus]